jgi:uncharacterized membrane protein YfcA
MAIVMLGGAVQSSLGFGLGVVVLPVFAIVSPESIPQTLILMIVPSSAFIMMQEWGDIRWASVFWILAGRTTGTLPGLFLLLLLPPRALQLLFSFASLAALFAMVRVQREWTVNRRAQLLGGALSGVMGTATSLGGIPLALLYAKETPQQIRSVLATSLFLGNILSLVGLYLSGRFSAGDARLAAVLLIPMAIGMHASSLLISRIGPRQLTLLVYVVVGFGSTIGIVMSLMPQS